MSDGRSGVESMDSTDRLELLPAFDKMAGVSSVKYTLHTSPGVWLPVREIIGFGTSRLRR